MTDTNLEQLEDALVEWSGYVTADDAPRTLREHASPHIKMLRAELGRLHALAASAPVAPTPPSKRTLETLKEWEKNGELIVRAWKVLHDQETEIVRLERELAAAPKASPAPASDLEKAVRKLHAAKGRYHNQIAACDLYDLLGLPNFRPGQEPAPPAQEALLNPDMPVQELRLHMGELTTDEALVARAAIRWANSRITAAQK